MIRMGLPFPVMFSFRLPTGVYPGVQALVLQASDGTDEGHQASDVLE